MKKQRHFEVEPLPTLCHSVALKLGEVQFMTVRDLKRLNFRVESQLWMNKGTKWINEN